MLQQLRRSKAWLPFAKAYQRSGLKARVYSRFDLRVKTVSQSALLAQLGPLATTPLSPPEFRPPIAAEAGPMPLEDTVFFSQFLARLRPLRVFEFGTNWGISTANIALNTPEDARIWTMDVCQEMFSPDALAADRELQMILTREHTGWFYRQSAALHKKVEQVFADSRTFDMATMREPEGGFDLVLVDACHKYDFVLKDTENALKKLRPGGWILWHDYYPDVSSWVDVFRYLSDFARTHQGVMHAKGTHFAFWRKP